MQKSEILFHPRYVKNHKKLKLDQEPSIDYIGHPINAFNFIKHSAQGWRIFNENVNERLNETVPALNYILNRDNFTSIPDHSEIQGAAFGVARLHNVYGLNTEKMVKEGVINTNLNMEVVHSKPSIIKFSGKELKKGAICRISSTVL